MSIINKAVSWLFILASGIIPAASQSINPQIGGGLGFGFDGAIVGLSAKAVFSTPRVVLSTGDSQSLSTISAGDQTTCNSAYVVSPKIKVRNAAGAWVTYTPGTSTGLNYTSNTGACGTETGFINSWRTTYPNDDLYVIKYSGPGSYQTIGLASAQAFNITTAGSPNTYTVNSGALLGNNTILTGAGVPTGTYIPFSNFLTTAGTTGYVGTAFGPVALTQYNGTISWSSTQGLLYNGNSAAINNGARAFIASALASLVTPTVIVHFHDVGTNDAGLTGLSQATMQTELTSIYSRFTADFGTPYAASKLVIMCTGTGGASATNVRLAEAAFRNGTTSFMLATNTYTRWDGTHLDLAAQLSMGSLGFQIGQGTFTGVTTCP